MSGMNHRPVAIAALLTLSRLSAQDASAVVMAIDPSGAVVVTASASFLGADDRPVRTAKPDASGKITFPDLPVGRYHLAVVAPGFKTKVLTTVVALGDHLRIDVKLDVCAGILERCD